MKTSPKFALLALLALPPVALAGAMAQMILAGGDGVVTVSGESIVHAIADPANATAGVRFNTDGTVDQIVNVSATQIDTATDWVIPNSSSSGHQIRYTNLAGSPVTSSLTQDVWASLSGDISISVSRTTIGTNQSTFDVEIRLGTGATLDSGSYTLTATVN